MEACSEGAICWHAGLQPMWDLGQATPQQLTAGKEHLQGMDAIVKVLCVVWLLCMLFRLLVADTEKDLSVLWLPGPGVLLMVAAWWLGW